MLLGLIIRFEFALCHTELSDLQRQRTLQASKVNLKPGRLTDRRPVARGFQALRYHSSATGEGADAKLPEASRRRGTALHAARPTFEDRSGPWRKMSASDRGKVDLASRRSDREEHRRSSRNLKPSTTARPIFESRNVDMPMTIDVLRYYADGLRRFTARPSTPSDAAFTYSCGSRSELWA